MAMLPIAGGIQTPPLLPGQGQTRPSPEGNFVGSLSQMLRATDAANAEANQAVARMLDGTGDVHDAMIAIQRADIALQFSVQVRNKLVQAYQEIMRMPV